MTDIITDKPKTILIIDDTADFREIFSLKLGAAGYTVITAPGGVEGIAMAKENKPALILLDMEMPGKNGVETLMDLKADPETKDIQVCFLTSYGEVKESQAWLDNKFAEEMGAIDYIRKTDDTDKIVEHVGRLMQEIA